MRSHNISAPHAMRMLIGTLCTSGLGLSAVVEAGCPPEEQAVLAAYAQCAAFYRQSSLADKATALDANATRLGDACGAETSEFLGVDPYQDLLDCAQAMAEAAHVTQARSVEPVAQAYRAEQMRRLTMHGGKLLDPERYVGRPVDYESKLTTHGPVEERITTTEFSAGKPKGGGWKLLTSPGRMPVVYWKEPAWMSTPPVKGQNVVVVLTGRSPGFALSGSAQDFPEALERLLRRSAAKQLRVVALEATHARDPADYCARYVMIEEESDNPKFPGTVLETSTWGLACLERSSRVVIQAYYSESKPRGAPTVLDDVVRGEAEAFLQDIIFEPKH
jgi:hypothetical protein